MIVHFKFWGDYELVYGTQHFSNNFILKLFIRVQSQIRLISTITNFYFITQLLLIKLKICIFENIISRQERGLYLLQTHKNETIFVFEQQVYLPTINIFLSPRQFSTWNQQMFIWIINTCFSKLLDYLSWKDAEGIQISGRLKKRNDNILMINLKQTFIALQNTIQMISKQQLVHKIEVVIAISQVSIEIRFPCKLQLGVKIGKNETNINQEAELKNKLATFSEKTKIDTLAIYDSDTRRYLQKKAVITIYVVSPRGKNVAGMLTVDLANILNQPSKEQSFTNRKLQRCPDRDATINLKIRTNILEELLDGNLSLASDGSGVFIQSGSKVASTISDKLKIDPKIFSDRLDNLIQQRKTDRNLNHNNKRFNAQQPGTSTLNKLLEHRNDTSSKSLVREDAGLLSQNYKLKTKISELQREISSLKREVLDKKRLQNELDSSLQKISQLQKIINGSKLDIESSNKEKKRQIIQLSNRVQELQKLNMTLQKRMDAKSNFYKDELQKYNSKIISVQNQKQQIVLEVSTLKNQNLNLNRTMNGLKDREKLLMDQKVKLTKKIQQLKRQYIEKQSSTDNTNKDIIYDRLKQTISNNQVEKLSLIDQLQKLKSQVVSEGVFRTKYEQQLRDKNNIIQQKLYLQKQHSTTIQQTTNQITKLNRQLLDKTDEVYLLNQKLTEFANKNKFQFSKAAEQIQSLKYNLQFARKAEEKGRYSYEEISFALQQNQKQLSEVTRKSNGLESALNDVRNQNQYLKTNMAHSLEQDKKMNLQISKLNSIIKNFQSQLLQQSEQKRNRQDQYRSIFEKLEETNKKLQKQLLAKEDEFYILKTQLAQQQQQLNSQVQGKQKLLKAKQQDLRNILQEETNLQLRNIKLQSIQTQLRENIRVLQSNLNKQKSENQNLLKINTTLQLSQNYLKQELQMLKSRFEQRESQCRSLIEANQYFENLLKSNKIEFERFKQIIEQHIHTLLRCLVSKNSSQELLALDILPDGLIKLQSDVINKIKASYEELAITTQKLINKEMELIQLQQSSNMQGNTFQIELVELRKQTSILKQQNFSLSSALENTRIMLASQNQNLKKQIIALQAHSTQSTSHLRQTNMKFEIQYQQIKDQQERQRKQFQERMQNLQNQLVNFQNRLSYKQSQLNAMSLKNQENNEVIRQLQQKLLEGSSKEGNFEEQRNRLVNDVVFLDGQLRRLVQEYQILKRGHAITLQKEAILIQQNQYLRTQFENNSKSSLSIPSKFQNREKSVVQIHRFTNENIRLNRIIEQLDIKLHNSQNAIRNLQQNMGHLQYQNQEKQKYISNLQIQMNNLRKIPNSNQPTISIRNLSNVGQSKNQAGLRAKVQQILNFLNNLIISSGTGMRQQLQHLYTQVQKLLRIQNIQSHEGFGVSSYIS